MISPSTDPSLKAQSLTARSFIGEETYSAGTSRDYLVTSSPTWIVDPLDGTVNYSHLFPLFCVSIAFCLAGEPVVGVIYAPVLDTTYSALKGHGAWLNDSTLSSKAPEHKRRQRLPLVRDPVPPLPINAPKGCIFSCEFGKQRSLQPGSNFPLKIDSFLKMASEASEGGGMVHGVRCLGSATLDLAYVATGAFDIWWEGGCWEWDVAAGICILREAGGLITSCNPPANPETDPIGEVRLGSRLYLAIRPAGDSEGETGRQAQERVVREVWKRVKRLEYVRPGA
jgi:myo-inositol-1(or 4)-monophosphatase